MLNFVTSIRPNGVSAANAAAPHTATIIVSFIIIFLSNFLAL
jgi:hypothetical protein